MVNVIDAVRAKAANARCINTPSGSRIIPIHDGLYDIFIGVGWKHQSRFRIVKLRGAKRGEFTRQLIQVNGLHLTQEQRQALLQLVH